MNWRAVLRAEIPTPAPSPHYSHNPQNSSPSANCGDCGDIGDRDSKLLEALAAACAGLGIKPGEVRAALAVEDVEAWEAGELPGETLTAFARSLAQLQAMATGQVPSHYTTTATCRHCGPVWTWPEDGKIRARPPVLSCPWCWNRLDRLPIPRPEPLPCGDCRHFMRRADHPRLGSCAAGEPEAPAGLWDAERRACLYWLPVEVKP